MCVCEILLLRVQGEISGIWRAILMFCSEQYVYRKFALLKSFNFTTSKERNSHSFQAKGLILVSPETKFCFLQSRRELFFNFRILKKSCSMGFKFLGKKAHFQIKFNNSKKNNFRKKTLYSFVEQNIASIYIRSNSVG